jgi:hypothetical protein
MPRADRLSRSDVEQRLKASQIDRALIARLVLKAPEIKRPGRKLKRPRRKLIRQLISTIKHYRQRVLADEQERPARIVAALKPGLKPARELLEWLNSLPVSVLIELRAGGILSTLPRIKNRVAYWQRRVAAHRPAGEDARNRELRWSLTDIITAHWPDPPDATDRQKRTNRWERHRWVAFTCKQIGAKYPNEKKNRRRFIGEHKPEASKRWRKHSRIRQSKAERRLKDVPI